MAFLRWDIQSTVGYVHAFDGSRRTEAESRRHTASDGGDAVVTSRDSQEDAHPNDALHDAASRRNPIAGQRQPLPDYVVFSQLSVISTVIPIFPPKLPNDRDVTLPSA